jgi:sugar/nucleoside kinase (ribokinase family)
MTLTFDVIVVGSYSIDLIFSGMDEFPQLGKDVISKYFKITPGEAYITAVCMHRLGIKVGWASDFGNDDFSRIALEKSREEGLDESLFVHHDHPFRRISVSASYPTDRGFLTYYDPDPPLPAGLSAIRKSQAKLLLIPGLYYGRLLDVGKKLTQFKKMKLFMDGNSSNGNIYSNTRESKSIRKAIKNADIFSPNAQEARTLTGTMNLEIAIRQLGALCPCVVIKDGSNGSLAYTNNRHYHVPAIPIRSIDTTGAGDNFNAGFLRAWLNFQSIETCLKWGNILGGLSTTELGGTTRMITADDVIEVISREYPN